MKVILLSLACSLFLSACVGMRPQPAAAREVQPPHEVALPAVSGHLICTATHCFFAPDAAGKAVLEKAGSDMAQEEVYMMVPAPEPEPYFAFRSTYLPPVRSFMRVEAPIPIMR